MIHCPRKSLALLVSGLVLVGILFGPRVISPAKADVGVQPILPDGSSIQPKVETPIQMVSERIVFNVRQATEWDSAAVKFNPMAYGLQTPLIPIWQLSVAEVTADFTMANPTNKAVSMTVWFPLASALEEENEEWEAHIGEIAPRIENFQIAINGKSLAFNISELPNPKGEDKPLLPWASFPVTFPAGEEVLIQVTYMIWAQQDISGVGMTLSYIFQTGAGWDGPIGKAELVVNLPYFASAETIGAMPAGGQIEGYKVRWTWENLEPGPQDDFSIWLIRQERWEELETARLAVQAWPEDGEAWLKLADTYRRLVLGKYQILPGFGETYQPLGMQAAKEALRLLPNDGRPHYELAIFYLATLPKNPSSEEIQPILEELKIVEELAPAYAGDVHDWFELIVGISSWNDYWATETAVAALMQIPSTTPIPSATPSPLPTPRVSQPRNITGNGQGLVIIAGASVIGLIVLGYLVWKRK